MSLRPRGYARIHALAGYIASQCLSQAAGLVRSLIVPNLLGPAGYGLLSTVNAVDRYTPYVSVGAHYYVLNRLPMVAGEERRQEILDSVFGFTLATSLLAAGILVAAALWQMDTLPMVAVFGLATLALNPLSSGVWRLHAVTLRVDERIPLMTRLTNAQSLAASALVIGLTYLWGIAGAFAAQFLTAVFVLILALVASPYRFRPRLHWRMLRTVLAFAIPVFVISGLLTTAMDSTEVFVLASALGAASVGIYAWGVGIAALLFVWMNATTTVYSSAVVRAAHDDQETGARQSGRFFMRLLLANSLVFAALATVLYVFLPVIGRVIYPGFESGLWVARLLVLSAYYESLGVLGLFVLTTRNRFNAYLVFLALLVAVVLPLLWWLAPRGIAWVAGLAIVRRFVKAHAVLWLALGDIVSRVRFLGYCGLLYVVGLAPVAVGWLVDLQDLAVTRQNVATFAPELLGAFAAVAVGLTVLLYLAQRKFRVLGVLWQS